MVTLIQELQYLQDWRAIPGRTESHDGTTVDLGGDWWITPSGRRFPNRTEALMDVTYDQLTAIFDIADIHWAEYWGEFYDIRNRLTG